MITYALLSEITIIVFTQKRKGHLRKKIHLNKKN